MTEFTPVEEDRPNFRVVERECVFEGALLHVRVDHIEDASGRRGTREVVEHPGAVAAVVLDDHDRVFLVRQWRQALGRRTIEVPAGKYDADGESAQETLRRELVEELGVEGGSIRWLGTVATSPGWSDEVVDVAVVEGVVPVVGGRPPGDWEEAELEVITASFAEALDLIAAAAPADAKSVAAMSLYALVRAGMWSPSGIGPPSDVAARRRVAGPASR